MVRKTIIGGVVATLMLFCCSTTTKAFMPTTSTIIRRQTTQTVLTKLNYLREHGHDVMSHLQEIQKLTVTVIVENTSDSMSAVMSESGEPITFEVKCDVGHEREGGSGKFSMISEKMKMEHRDGYYGPANQCRASHGLSLLLVAETMNGEEHTMLLDAGGDPDLWHDNAVKRLRIDPAQIEAIVLSHYHYDHAGGLLGAIDEISTARTYEALYHNNALDPPIVDVHPAHIYRRGTKAANGVIYPHHPHNPNTVEMTQVGGAISKHDKEHNILDDCFYVSGYIPRNTFYETGTHGSVNWAGNDKGWIDDNEIVDERYVAVNVKGAGLVIFTACSHAGIINICRDAKMKSDNQPIIGVIGGLHLAGLGKEERVEYTLRDLHNLNPNFVLAGHCTGWRAKLELAKKFGQRFHPLTVGSSYTFESSS